MTAGERFKNWIEGLSVAWGDRLRGWMMSWIARGLNSLIDEVEPGLSLSVEDTLFKVRDDPATPEALRNLINKVTTPGHPLPLALVVPIALLMLIPTVTSIFQPLGNLWRYKQERVLKTARFDPISAITAWRRDPVRYAYLFNDLRDQGWSDESIEALKFITLFIPSAQDQITWLAREVFEPDMIERYGLKDELPVYENTDFSKIGVDPVQMANYWMAHWEHASFMQIREMLHRGVLSMGKEMPSPPTTKAGWEARDKEGREAAYDWYRLVEIPPFWRARLTEMLFEVPTRVDIRRWYDMRTIDESELYNLYHRQGYVGRDLDNYVIWTKVYTEFPTLMARWSKGWVTLDEVRQRLIGLGMPAGRVEELIQEKVKAEQPARVEAERALTVTDIIMGIKKAVITREEGVELIMDLGYGRAEAEFKVDVRVTAAEGSPETFAEFKDITTKYKRAIGKEELPMPEEIKKLGAEVVRLSAEVAALQRSIKEEQAKLIDIEVLPEAATARVTELQVTLHRTEAELARVTTDYKAKLAEWRHAER